MAKPNTIDRLYAQLHVWAGTPHEWSYCDCFMVMGEWVEIVQGVNPLAEIRGTYGDPAMCPVARKYRLEAVELGDRLFAGFPTPDEAALGDVAVVSIPGQRHFCGAIKLKGTAWAMKVDSRSMAVVRYVTPQRIWSVGYEA